MKVLNYDSAKLVKLIFLIIAFCVSLRKYFPTPKSSFFPSIFFFLIYRDFVFFLFSFKRLHLHDSSFRLFLMGQKINSSY